MNTVAFFNNKGGVGKTTLVYHLAWMFAERGIPTLAVDLDPQANLTTMCLSEDRLETIWDSVANKTVFGSVQPLMTRMGDIQAPHVEQLSHNLGLIPGDLALSRFEDLLSENWSKCLDGEEAAFRVMTAFHRVILEGATARQAELVLIDVGPNLGAINRAAMITAQHVVIPLAADLFSLQGLKNIGPTLREWRKGWKKRRSESPANANLSLPEGCMEPTGYVVTQHSIRGSRPVKAYRRWIDRIPGVYREFVLDDYSGNVPALEQDSNNLALLKHFGSLMPLAMEAGKPMFFLKHTDGAIGAHVYAVKDCYDDFLKLAKKIATRINIPLC